MAKCKCGAKSRVVSDVVQSLNNNGGQRCIDVCASPICADPNLLGIMAPLIYDEIGINLCTTFSPTETISTTYPTATNATIKVINATYADCDVVIEAITGRPNCYRVTLSDITLQFAMNLYDSSCRLVGTVYPTAVYLPSATTAPTYDEDTNPDSVELEIFAPYGVSYTAATPPVPMINVLGFNEDNNMVRQGLNLSAMAKLLDLNLDENTITVGVTLVLQSLYFAGYKVASAGKIDIPKGSILPPEDSDCMKFVEGDLLNLEIKPLDLGAPGFEENYKQQCCNNNNTNCPVCNGGTFNNTCNTCGNGAVDDTVVITSAPAE